MSGKATRTETADAGLTYSSRITDFAQALFAASDERIPMTFKPKIWQPIAVVLSAINLVGVGLAAGAAEPWHAAVHSGLALAFGLWAQRLRQSPQKTELQTPLETLGALEAEMGEMRRELSETQERLDFAERLLAQRPEARRMEPPNHLE
jgi:hypothetical protein